MIFRAIKAVAAVAEEIGNSVYGGKGSGHKGMAITKCRFLVTY